MPVAITQGLNEKCCDCGIALKKSEIDGEIEGSFSDYGEHEQGTLRLKFCSGCWGRIKEILRKDQGDAILKRKELERDFPVKQLDFSGAEDNFLKENPLDFRSPDGVGEGI